MNGPVLPTRLYPLLSSLPKLRSHRKASRFMPGPAKRIADWATHSRRSKSRSAQTPASGRDMMQRRSGCSLESRICSKLCRRSRCPHTVAECPLLASWSYQELGTEHDQ